MAHEVETMAYANQTPWHGLGARVDENISIEEMLKAAGLDWGVEKWPLFAIKDGVTVAATKRALVRTTDKRVLTIVGDEWNPLQNRDALEFFREYCASGGATLETAGSLRNGKMVWGLARLNKMYEVTKGDQVNGYVLLASPHEFGKSISVKVTSVRVVCANTMAMALSRGGEHRQSHIREFDAALAKQEIGLATEQFMQDQKIARTLQKLKMDIIKTVEALVPTFQPAEAGMQDSKWAKLLVDDPANQNKRLQSVLGSIQTAPGATPENAWGVLNGVTHWADHVAGYHRDSRLNNAWFGNNAKVKVEVRDRLLALAA